MDDLVSFLRGRLDEDEHWAREACGPRWELAEEGICHCCLYVRDVDSGAQVAFPDGRDAPHIARHDPGRVLRDVEAARAIVTRCELVSAAFADRAGGAWPDVSRRERAHADATLCALAAVYSDHPDYQQEWKP